MKGKENVTLHNAKISTIKNLKIFGSGLKIITSWTLPPLLIAGGFSLIGSVPFHRDKVKEYLSTMTEIDNRGNYRIEEQYGNFENDTNILYYYSKWQKNANGFYERNIQEYTLKNLEYEEIMNLFENNNIVLEDVINKKISDKIERKSILDEEDKYEEPYIKIMTYDESTNEFIVREQTVLENIVDSILYLIVTTIIESGLIEPQVDLTINNIDNCRWYIKEAKKKKK